jgi:hypothetical protein
MKKIAFVSSMNLKLYEYYGKRFLQEFAKFSSEDLLLFIIFEGFDYPEEILHIGKNIIIIPLVSTEHTNFLYKFGKLQEAKGLKIITVNENGVKKLKGTYDYRWNAIRFSFKPFSIHQVLGSIPSDLDYLIWTDADLRCKEKFGPNELIDFMPLDGEIMSYLGRENSYSECGFLGFNMKNPQTKDYINRMIEIYESGEIFAIAQWHDSFIWDWARVEFETKKNAKFRDISGDGRNKEHVYVNTKLSHYFDHLKGPQRKEAGTSSSEDLSKEVGGRIVTK